MSNSSCSKAGILSDGALSSFGNSLRLQDDDPWSIEPLKTENGAHNIEFALFSGSISHRWISSSILTDSKVSTPRHVSSASSQHRLWRGFALWFSLQVPGFRSLLRPFRKGSRPVDNHTRSGSNPRHSLFDFSHAKQVGLLSSHYYLISWILMAESPYVSIMYFYTSGTTSPASLSLSQWFYSW